MNKRLIVIATRKSPLALAQANQVKVQLLHYHPCYTVTLLALSTQADQWLERPIQEHGGKGAFVKELEEALLSGRADIAVHSMKDLPLTLPSALHLSAICERIEARDVFISNHYASLYEATQQSTKMHIGTSSLRRKTQLYALRNDITISPLRGNIHTRLSRLDAGEFDAIILAAAGLHRVGLKNRIRDYFHIEELLPAAGQGALGIECRKDDQNTESLLKSLNDTATHAAVTAERALCTQLGGNCHMPIGAFAQYLPDHQLCLKGLVGNNNGSKILRAEASSTMEDAITLGITVGKQLLALGAEALLR